MQSNIQDVRQTAKIQFMQMNQEKTDSIGLIFKSALKIFPPFAVGIMAKIASDVKSNRKLPVLGWVAIVALSLAGTFLSNWICEFFDMSKNKTIIINALSTILSEKLFDLLFSNFFLFAAAWVKENLKFTLKSIEEGEANERKKNKK